MDFDKLIIDSIDLATGFDIATGEVLFMMDEIKDGSIENASETVYLTGKNGARIGALDRNKTAKASFNNGFMVGGAIATQIGTAVTLATAGAKFTVPTFDILTVGDTPTTVTLTNVPVGATGAEIKFIYKANKDGTQGEKYAIAATASATEFSLVPATKIITLPTGSVFDTGDRVIVFYDYEASVGKKYVNSGDKFAATVKLVLDLVLRDVCDNATIYHGKMIFDTAKVDGTFNIGVGDTPEAHAFSAEAISNICSTNKELWTWYIVE